MKPTNVTGEISPMKKGKVGVASGSYCQTIPVRQIQPDLIPETEPEEEEKKV